MTMKHKVGPYKVHPVAGLFPMMDDTALVKLTEDIGTHGQREPIVLNHDETVIVDGRNRYLACQNLGLEPDAEVLDDSYTDDDLRDYIISANLHRRHLTTGQRAVLATELLPFFEAEARQHKSACASAARKSLRSGRGAVPQDRGKSVPVLNRSAAKAGNAVGVGAGAVNAAKAVKRDAPDLAKKVVNGEMSLNTAYKESKRRNGLHIALKDDKQNPAHETRTDTREPERDQAMEEANMINDFAAIIRPLVDRRSIRRYSPACKQHLIAVLQNGIDKLQESSES
jgi:ParB-like chromosome segregation protein Spo0J